MKKLFFVLLLVCLVAALSAKIKVGDEVVEKFATPHPYKGGVTTEQIFHWPEAGYISLHFSKFDLAPGDTVEISDPTGEFSYTYREKGKAVRGGAAVLSEFWGTHIPGDTAIVRLVSRNPRGGFGFEIDKWVHGYPREQIEIAFFKLENGFEQDASIEAICGTDDKEWAQCYIGTTMYDKARAVCRLLMEGSSACTGWLIGSEGHVISNDHCIGSQSTADQTDFEFMAERSCSTNCSGWLACPGTVEASSATMIKTDYDLDYTLVLLPTNVSGTYGYLQLRDTLPTINERIYIPQHASAYGKQMAVYSTHSQDQSGFGEVYTTSATPCHGGPGDIGYYADTAGGSSGSPVLAYADHLVVALHHCANCPNRGAPIPAIITHLGASLPADAIGGGPPPDPPAAPSNLTAAAAACDQIDLTWTDNSANESSFKIERSTDGSNFSQIGSVGADVTSFSDTGLAENTTYWYRVRASNSGGDSAYSNIASDTTPTCPVIPPAAPGNVVAKARGKSKIALTWVDNSNNEDGFRIYRGPDAGSLTLYDTIGPNLVEYVDTGVQSKTIYFYKVCSFNANGEGCSGVVSATTK